MNATLQKILILVALAILFMAVLVAAYRTNSENHESNHINVSVNPSAHNERSHSGHRLNKDQNGVDEMDDINGMVKNDTVGEQNIPRHEDMLSEEIKQSIREKLLLEGPMEVIHHPDGSIELPANGRFTQMPVAVKRADGSIEIKEYSTLAE